MSDMQEFKVVGLDGSEDMVVGWCLAESQARIVAHRCGMATVLNEDGRLLMTHHFIKPPHRGLLGWLLGYKNWR